jgi:predicted dienelactone hydrolase
MASNWPPPPKGQQEKTMSSSAPPRRLKPARGVGFACLVSTICMFMATGAFAAPSNVLPNVQYPVGFTQVEYHESKGGRPLDLMMIYPADRPSSSAKPFRVFMATNLTLYQDAPIVSDHLKHPLIMFSHGAGGNASVYAWFGEYLASHGYIVAMAYHYQANTFDSSALYVRNRLWQRPRDISLDITLILKDKAWGPHIDPDKIGVAGHSQGGFTSIWLGGAEVNPQKFLVYQKGWKNNQMVPLYLRKQMSLDARPAEHVRDERIKAAFAMAPGDIQGFGMDAAGLRSMAIPLYVIVGAADTTAPLEENAKFATDNVDHSHLDVMPGQVGHEIFDNECDQLGRDNYPESCVDAPTINRTLLHEHIGRAALQFFDETLHVQREAKQ